MAENHPIKKTFKVNINCCLACPRILKKGLEKKQGVEWVDVYPKKNMVSVTSTLTPQKLIKKMDKILKKKAELLPSIDPHQDDDEDNDDEETDEDDHEQHARTSCCHHDDDNNNNDNNCNKNNNNCHGAQNNYNNAQEYFMAGPKEYPEHICKDVHCRIHRRDSVIYDRIPQMNYMNPMFNYGGGRVSYPIRGSSYYMPPPPPPPPYGMMPPPPPVYYGGGAMPRGVPRPMNGGYGDYFSDENSNGCCIM